MAKGVSKITYDIVTPKSDRITIQASTKHHTTSLSPYHNVAVQAFATAANTLRSRLTPSLCTRGGGGGPSHWTTPGHEERPKGFTFNRTPESAGQSRKWKDWELPCYLTSFLTIIILGVGLSAKPNFTMETWAHQKDLDRLELEASQRADSD
ncbi:hypothetical protein AAHA92_15756 [Salvia divinorum]|uniref:Uncharacterized protein n=1 Tax=Salvia divinorum TaxID=28513 RepID=A0ABD1HJS2_SALDI